MSDAGNVHRLFEAVWAELKLLLEWRQADDGWEGLVAYVIPEPRGPGGRLGERWIGAAHLEPV